LLYVVKIQKDLQLIAGFLLLKNKDQWQESQGGRQGGRKEGRKDRTVDQNRIISVFRLPIGKSLQMTRNISTKENLI